MPPGTVLLAEGSKRPLHSEYDNLVTSDSVDRRLLAERRTKRRAGVGHEPHQSRRRGGYGRHRNALSQCHDLCVSFSVHQNSRVPAQVARLTVIRWPRLTPLLIPKVESPPDFAVLNKRFEL